MIEICGLAGSKQGQRIVRLGQAGLFIVVSAVFALGCLVATYWWSERYFLAETAERGRTSLNLNSENMRGWLGRYRALPRIYAQNPNVSALLRDPKDPVLLATVNDFLSEWNLATGAADTYLLDHQGTAIAASNWADEITFVGNNYAYRPYYTQAVQGRLGRFFALGTSSGRRGYYFSYPVHEGRDIKGVMVVKVGVEEVEADMSASPDEVFVTGPEGVILLAGRPAWRLKSLAPLDEAARQRISENRQFDLEKLASIDSFGPAMRGGEERLVEARRGGGERQEYLHLSLPMTIEGWTLHILVETDFARNQTVTTVLLAASLLFAVGLVAIVIWQRRRRLVDLLAEREKARATLERTVADRTADLRSSNLQLAAEVEERTAAETELRQTQAELVQAGKLAALGQMSAAFSHELNQPLAAIRTYADNAGLFLDRGREAEARENIVQIASLTERMAGLSKHLSSFARKPQVSTRPVSLSAALAETLELLDGRFRAAGVAPKVTGLVDNLWVVGGHIRLQQVIMNLITNALDAMKDQDRPQIQVMVEGEGEAVRLIVEDNGAGLPSDRADQIFDPFFTTKEVGEGLGLGLAISYNIVRDFGGTLAAENREEGGARFILTLKSTPAPQGSDETAEEAAQ